MQARDEWLTIQQACEILQIGHYTLWKLRKKGIIRSYYPWGTPEEGSGGGHKLVRLSRDEIENFMKRRP